MNREIEQSYIKRILGGDTNSFSYFINTYSNAVFTLIVRVVQSREDAEELTQDTFLKAFSKLDGYRGDCSFSTWLYRIAYNTAISSVRKVKVVLPAIDDYVINSVADNEVDILFANDENELLLQKMETAIEQLPPEEKALITLFYLQNKPIAEIAEILQFTVENIKVKLHRTRKKLYVIIQNDHRYE